MKIIYILLLAFTLSGCATPAPKTIGIDEERHATFQQLFPPTEYPQFYDENGEPVAKTAGEEQ